MDPTPYEINSSKHKKNSFENNETEKDYLQNRLSNKQKNSKTNCQKEMFDNTLVSFCNSERIFEEITENAIKPLSNKNLINYDSQSNLISNNIMHTSFKSFADPLQIINKDSGLSNYSSKLSNNNNTLKQNYIEEQIKEDNNENLEENTGNETPKKAQQFPVQSKILNSTSNRFTFSGDVKNNVFSTYQNYYNQGKNSLGGKFKDSKDHVLNIKNNDAKSFSVASLSNNTETENFTGISNEFHKNNNGNPFFTPPLKHLNDNSSLNSDSANLEAEMNTSGKFMEQNYLSPKRNGVKNQECFKEENDNNNNNNNDNDNNNKIENNSENNNDNKNNDTPTNLIKKQSNVFKTNENNESNPDNEKSKKLISEELSRIFTNSTANNDKTGNRDFFMEYMTLQSCGWSSHINNDFKNSSNVGKQDEVYNNPNPLSSFNLIQNKVNKVNFSTSSTKAKEKINIFVNLSFDEKDDFAKEKNQPSNKSKSAISMDSRKQYNQLSNKDRFIKDTVNKQKADSSKIGKKKLNKSEMHLGKIKDEYQELWGLEPSQQCPSSQRKKTFSQQIQKKIVEADLSKSKQLGTTFLTTKHQVKEIENEISKLRLKLQKAKDRYCSNNNTRDGQLTSAINSVKNQNQSSYNYHHNNLEIYSKKVSTQSRDFNQSTQVVNNKDFIKVENHYNSNNKDSTVINNNINSTSNNKNGQRNQKIIQNNVFFPGFNPYSSDGMTMKSNINNCSINNLEKQFNSTQEGMSNKVSKNSRLLNSTATESTKFISSTDPSNNVLANSTEFQELKKMYKKTLSKYRTCNQNELEERKREIMLERLRRKDEQILTYQQMQQQKLKNFEFLKKEKCLYKNLLDSANQERMKKKLKSSAAVKIDYEEQVKRRTETFNKKLEESKINYENKLTCVQSKKEKKLRELDLLKSENLLYFEENSIGLVLNKSQECFDSMFDSKLQSSIDHPIFNRSVQLKGSNSPANNKRNNNNQKKKSKKTNNNDIFELNSSFQHKGKVSFGNDKQPPNSFIKSTYQNQSKEEKKNLWNIESSFKQTLLNSKKTPNKFISFNKTQLAVKSFNCSNDSNSQNKIKFSLNSNNYTSNEKALENNHKKNSQTKINTRYKDYDAVINNKKNINKSFQLEKEPDKADKEDKENLNAHSKKIKSQNFNCKNNIISNNHNAKEINKFEARKEHVNLKTPLKDHIKKNAILIKKNISTEVNKNPKALNQKHNNNYCFLNKHKRQNEVKVDGDSKKDTDTFDNFLAESDQQCQVIIDTIENLDEKVNLKAYENSFCTWINSTSSKPNDNVVDSLFLENEENAINGNSTNQRHLQDSIKQNLQSTSTKNDAELEKKISIKPKEDYLGIFTKKGQSKDALSNTVCLDSIKKSKTTGIQDQTASNQIHTHSIKKNEVANSFKVKTNSSEDYSTTKSTKHNNAGFIIIKNNLHSKEFHIKSNLIMSKKASNKVDDKSKEKEVQKLELNKMFQKEKKLIENSFPSKSVNIEKTLKKENINIHFLTAVSPTEQKKLLVKQPVSVKNCDSKLKFFK